MDQVFSVKARVSGEDFDVDLPLLDAGIMGTHLEPFASMQFILPFHQEKSDGITFENLRMDKHIRSFKTEDLGMFQETTKHSKPILIPFSRFLPSDLGSIFKRVANENRSDDDVRFPPHYKSVFEAIYPVYLPFYLIELEDMNTAYEKKLVSRLLKQSSLIGVGSRGIVTCNL